jgi:hypothetical protein
VHRAPTAFTFPHKVVVPVASYRKYPDPVFPGIHHFTGYVPAVLYPSDGFPNDPNIRPPNIDRQVYKEIAESLQNANGIANIYHLKSKGEMQIAAHVHELSPEDAERWFQQHVRPVIADNQQYDDFKKKYKVIEITYEQGCGIADGGHTDQIWSDPDNQTAVRETFAAPADQGEEAAAHQPNVNHLPIEWVTGLPKDWVPEIVGGRNKALQVQEKTLANHQGKFTWIKDLLSGESFADKIAYRENEDRRLKPIDIRELIALIAPFNRDLYSSQGDPSKKSPVAAFSQKAVILDAYIADEDDGKTFRKLSPILKDILQLHDLIHLEARDLYNDATGGRGAGLDFVDHRDPKKQQKPHEFHFCAKSGPYRLMDGALYPILAAFAATVVERDGRFAWKDGFGRVKALWRELAAKFIEATRNINQQLGYNPAAVGKSPNHWEFLYLQVAMKMAMQHM